MIIQAICTSFKTETLQGTHAFGTDTFKIALYTSAASLDSTTTAYSTTNEIVGTGYSAGGAALTAVTLTAQGDATQTTTLNFANPTWPGATFTARGALVYNSSKSNKAVFVLDFGGDKTVANQTLTVRLPSNAATTAILQLK